jgi:hypothetical protein
MEQNKTDAQLVKKSFYGGRRFITVLQNPTARPYSKPVECSQHSGIPYLLNPLHTANNELLENCYSSMPKFLHSYNTDVALDSLVLPCVLHVPPLYLLLTLLVVTTACMVNSNLHSIVIERYLCEVEFEQRTN